MKRLTKIKRKKSVAVAILFIILGIIAYFCLRAFLHSLPPDPYKNSEKRIVLLLYKTDHYALLSACRKVLKETNEGKWERRQYSVYHKPDPDVYKLPKIILDLNPTYIYINKNHLVIEMLGGFSHLGVYAFSENTKVFGDKKLIEGLWYYDDGYTDVKDYETYIQSLKPSG